MKKPEAECMQCAFAGTYSLAYMWVSFSLQFVSFEVFGKASTTP